MFAVKRGEIRGRCDVVFHQPLVRNQLSELENSVFSPVSLGNVIHDIRYGTGTPPLYMEPSNDTVPFVRATDIKNGEVNFATLRYIAATQPTSMDKCRLSGGELIIVRSGVNTGDCAVVPQKLAGAYAAYDLIITLNSQVSAEFISTFLDTKIGRLQLNLVKGRAAQPHINADEVSALRIPLPPQDEQLRLVADMSAASHQRSAKLREADELLVGIDKLLLEQLGIAEILVKSHIASAVTLGIVKIEKTIGAEYYHPERLTVIRAIENNPAVSTRKLADIVDFLRETISAGGEPYLGLAGVVGNTGELSGAEDKAEGQAFSYCVGDILYARLRPYLNKVLFAETDGVCSTEFHVMRIKRSDVMPEYLAAIMRSKIIVAQTKHMMTGNTHPRISNDDVSNLRIPIPSIDIQRTVISEMRKRIERSRLLKREAETEWAAAKERFERELMGGTSK